MPPGAVPARHVAEMRAVGPGPAAGAPGAEWSTASTEPFLQVIYDIEVPRMAFGRVCLLGDAAFVVRPHAAAGTAKAAADAWALADALDARRRRAGGPGPVGAGQLALGAQLLERTRRIGRRSQVDGTWVPGDPELIFGLRGPGQ